MHIKYLSSACVASNIASNKNITQTKPRNEKGTSFPSPAVDFFSLLKNCTKNGNKGHIEKYQCFFCPFAKGRIQLKFVMKIIKYSCDTSLN